jgi:transcriptional regulator with XRE-family HTH domain
MEPMALMTDPAKVVAANLRRIMAQLGVTHAELAQRAEMQQPRISAILRGDHDPRVGTVDRLARALGVPLAMLLHPVEQESDKS